MATPSTNNTPTPTPDSLLDLPASWRLKFARSTSFKGDSDTLVALFRTCTYWRDSVLRERTTVVEVKLPLDPHDFPPTRDQLCVVARRSSNVRLVVEDLGELVSGQNSKRWSETEPSITHLLVCAAVQLGQKDLPCVKEVHLKNMDQTALVPPWVTLLCPNVTHLSGDGCLLARGLAPRQPLPLPPPPPPPQQQAPEPPHPQPHSSPLVPQHLQSLRKAHELFNGWDDEEVHRQLAALPSLTDLSVQNVWCMVAGAPSNSRALCQLLPDSLVRFDASEMPVNDSGLEALLSLPILREVRVEGFRLQHSHAHRTIPWRRLEVREVGVESFASLPLDSMTPCGWGGPTLDIHPAVDPTAVARVCAAVRRWTSGGGSRGIQGGSSAGQQQHPRLCFHAEDIHAVEATLPSFLAALPEEQRQHIALWGDCYTPEPASSVQQLARLLPPATTALRLYQYTLQPDAWPALLPSLPATINHLLLTFQEDMDEVPTDEQVVAMCGGAVRPITVTIVGDLRIENASLDEQDRVRQLVGQAPGAQQVTLRWEKVQFGDEVAY